MELVVIRIASAPKFSRSSDINVSSVVQVRDLLPGCIVETRIFYLSRCMQHILRMHNVNISQYYPKKRFQESTEKCWIFFIKAQLLILGGCADTHNALHLK